jgi:hypothetical protein
MKKIITKLAIGIALIIFGLNLSGFSYSRLKWTSDREFKLAAINTLFDRYIKQRFETPEAFLDRNPNCCMILYNSDENRSRVVRSIFFDYSVYVIVNYLTNVYDPKSIYQAEFFVDSNLSVAFNRSVDVSGQTNNLNY